MDGRRTPKPVRVDGVRYDDCFGLTPAEAVTVGAQIDRFIRQLDHGTQLVRSLQSVPAPDRQATCQTIAEILTTALRFEAPLQFNSTNRSLLEHRPDPDVNPAVAQMASRLRTFARPDSAAPTLSAAAWAAEVRLAKEVWDLMCVPRKRFWTRCSLRIATWIHQGESSESSDGADP